MNYLDIILVLPILFGAWKGFKKGFIIEVFTLLALIVGVYAALNFSDLMVNLLENNLNYHGKYSSIVAFILTFLLVGAMVYFLGKALEKVVNTVALGGVNKFIGLLVGASKMLVVSSVIVVILEAIDKKDNIISHELKTQSVLYEPIKKFSFNTVPSIKDSKLFKKESIINKVIDNVKNDLPSNK